MKTKVIMAVFAIAVLVAASAQEIRYVNDLPVDLAPLRAWLKTRKGERPLKHWKEIRVVSVSAVQSLPQCSVTIEGETRTVFLRNLSKSTVDAIAEAAALGQRVQQLGDYVTAERMRIDNLKADARSRAISRRVARYQTQQANLASANLATSTKQLDALRSRLKSAKELEQKLARELGMNTGQKYAGLEIWDCGQKR